MPPRSRRQRHPFRLADDQARRELASQQATFARVQVRDGAVSQQASTWTTSLDPGATRAGLTVGRTPPPHCRSMRVWAAFAGLVTIAPTPAAPATITAPAITRAVFRKIIPMPPSSQLTQSAGYPSKMLDLSGCGQRGHADPVSCGASAPREKSAVNPSATCGSARAWPACAWAALGGRVCGARGVARVERWWEHRGGGCCGPGTLKQGSHQGGLRTCQSWKGA